MRIVTIVGARPQFVKAAVLSRYIREKRPDIQEIIIHTGQHYDQNMSEIFFSEMDIPQPHLNLEIGGGTHGQMTGRMLEKIEEVLLREKPDCLLVYGDTNSTIAGALAASKIHIPVAHVEAGLRSFNMRMPEEQNRILTDHLSEHLFCPTETAVRNLAREGLERGVLLTGDIMYDASLFYRNKRVEPSLTAGEEFYLITLHRAENTDDPQRLTSLVNALNSFSKIPGVLPLHPRTKKMMESVGLSFGDNIRVIEPVGFLEMISLESRCQFIVTDSGGVQKEAYFFQKPCITMRDQTEWVETVEQGANILVGADSEKMTAALESPPQPEEWKELYGSGNSAEIIINALGTTR